MFRKVTGLPVQELSVAITNADQNRLPIDTIVIHTMVGTITSSNSRFNDPNSKVSAHYGVGYNGQLVHWVDEDWVAYHSGNYNFNQRSIGVEHEDYGNYDGPRPDALYTASAKLVADICKFYNIACDRTHILKHSEIVATGCPDALDVDRIVNEAAQILNNITPPTPPIFPPVVPVIPVTPVNNPPTPSSTGIFSMIWNWLRGKKTYLVSGLILAWSQLHLMGYIDTSTYQLGLSVLGALGLAAIRMGISGE